MKVAIITGGNRGIGKSAELKRGGRERELSWPIIAIRKKRRP